MPEPLKLADLKLRMQAYGVRPRKKLGQNILADFNLLKAIVADAEIGASDVVLEIGTGAGSLTGYLCDAAGLVISVELDPGMFELSRDILADVPNLVQVHADALNEHGRGLNPELESLLRERLVSNAGGTPAPLKLVANLPYSVATPVLIAALESGLPFERMLVMVQHEVAEKLAARPGDREWGLPALLVSRFAAARILRKVHAKVFWPKPNVDSALLELKPLPQRPEMQAYHRLRKLAHVLFQHRRKSSANALALALNVHAKQAATWISDAEGDPQHRPEQLAPAVLQRLAENTEIEPLVRMALDQHEAQIEARAEKRARRAEWKSRVYGDE